MSTARVDSSQPTSGMPALWSEPSVHAGGNAQFRKEGTDWFAIFNLNTRLSESNAQQPDRTLDVDLVHSVRHESVVCSVRFSPDGKYLATGSNHATQVYDVTTGERVCLFVDESVPRSEDHYIRSLCFSPDGKYLATGAEDGNVRIWSIHAQTLHKLFRGHTSEVYTLDYSPDGRLLASGSGDSTMRVWRVDDLTIYGQEQAFVIDVPPSSIQNHHRPASERCITSIAISPNSTLIAAASLDNLIRIWDVRSQTLVAQLEGHTASVYSVAFLWDGTQVVSGSLDCTVKRWDIAPLYQPPEQRVRPCECIYTYSGHQDYVLCVALSHDTTHTPWVISSSKDRSVMFWDISQTGTTSRPEFTLTGHRNSVISVDASPAGGLFATGGGDWNLKIWRYTMLQ